MLLVFFVVKAHLYDDPDDVNIPSLLDEKFDCDKCEALKRLLALIAQGIDVSNFFPQVVKNVASQSLETKKLVYLYLLHYAEKYAALSNELSRFYASVVSGKAFSFLASLVV